MVVRRPAVTDTVVRGWSVARGWPIVRGLGLWDWSNKVYIQ